MAPRNPVAKAITPWRDRLLSFSGRSGDPTIKADCDLIPFIVLFSHHSNTKLYGLKDFFWLAKISWTYLHMQSSVRLWR